MRLPSTRHWCHFLLAPLGLIVVVPGWLTAVIVSRIAAVRPPRQIAAIVSRIADTRLPRKPPWYRLVLLPVIPVLAALALILAIDNGIHPLVILGSVPIVALLVLMAAMALSAPDAGGDVLLPQLEPKTTWRLLDRNLSTWGVWRAEIESYPPGVEGFGDDMLAGKYVCDLIRDWSFRSGWPYLGCRVRQVFRAAPGVTGTFPSVSESEAIYRVTLDIREVIKHGWMRFGDGFAEFQLEPDPLRRSIHLDANLRKRVLLRLPWELPENKPVAARGQPPALAGPHPLWDRWLDG